MTASVLHLNGPPGVGKSTLAKRWADDHPGTLLLDVDALRTWVGGWREDFGATGALVRPVALAMIETYAASGHDVVLPQLLADPAEQARFRAAAERGGARWVEVFLVADDGDASQRFHDRDVTDPHLEHVRRLVTAAGPGHLEAYAEQLVALAAGDPDAVVVRTTTGDVDGAYAALVEAVAGAGSGRHGEGPASDTSPGV